MKVNMKKSRLSSLKNLQTKGANTMLEKMFTTKMSMDKKKLQNRFSKIRSKNGKTSKFIALAVFAVIIVSIICVSIWVAVSRQDDMILYENEAMNFKLEIPLSWQGKYIVDESAVDDNYIAFKHKGIAEKHDGMGTLFSVIKLPDSEIDEYMNMVGNMTVVWRNQDYGYLIGRPTDVQVPIFAGNDEEDIKLAEEYQKLYKDVSHIETTFSLINDVDTPNIVNAENLSYAQIRDLQRQVDNGHFPWRLDYEQVIKSFLSGKGIDVEGGEITELAGGGSAGGISLTYTVGEKEYTQIYSIELFKPIDKTESGIWLVRTFNDITDDAIESVRNKELLLLSDDSIQFKLNADVSTIDKEPISEKEGRGDGFHWKDYSYEDVSVRALIGDDNSTQITHISTTSNNYRTPRDVKVGDSLKKLQQKYPEDLSKALSDEVCYVYVPQSIGVNRIYFYLENDIITKIVVENGIDG